MNVGLFGGTFDPPHVGHLIVAQDAALALGLDRILFVPAGAPPHKLGMPVSGAALRARMLELAIAGDPRFDMDRVELERSGPSFTVETLRVLHARTPGARWTLFMGADQYAEFATWRSPDEIRRLARVAVLTRSGAAAALQDAGAQETGSGGGAEPREADPQGAWTGGGGGSGAGARPPVATLEEGVVRVDVTRIDVSATQIRRRVAAGLPIRYLVPAAVEEFIHERRLYSRNGPVSAG